MVGRGTEAQKQIEAQFVEVMDGKRERIVYSIGARARATACKDFERLYMYEETLQAERWAGIEDGV